VPGAGATTGRTTGTPTAKRQPRELDDPLRAGAARWGLPAPLQCRAWNPDRGTRCVQRSGAAAARTTVTPAAERRPPEFGGPLRAASAHQRLYAPLQGRARSPDRRSRCVPRAGARTGRTTVTPTAERQPPAWGGPLRAAAARKGLPAPLQCRAGNPGRGTRCVQKSEGDGRAHRSYPRRRATTIRVGRSAADRVGAQGPARLAAVSSWEPLAGIPLRAKSVGGCRARCVKK